MKMSQWFVERPSPSRAFRLFCFCYAGGNATNFATWQSELSPSISVCAIQLPGRGARYSETPYSAMPALIAALAEATKDMNNLPYAFFGHSMGGLVAFELARHKMRHGMPLPQHLFISGCHAAKHRNNSKPLHRLPTPELLLELKKYNGTPAEVLENSDLMELILPTLRADFSVVENYQYEPAQPLPIPITVFAGKDDELDSAEQITGWQEETSLGCRTQWFNGDHFFINTLRDEVLAHVSAELAPLLLQKELRCA